MNRLKDMQPTLVLIQGFLGAGKSTFTRALSKETGWVRLNADDLCPCAAEASGCDLTAWLQTYADAETRLWASAERSLSKGETVLMDLGFWTLSSRDTARRWAAERGHACALVWIEGTRDFLRGRIDARSGPIADANQARFEQLWAQFEPPEPRENAFLLQAHEPTQKQVQRFLKAFGYQP